MNKYFKRIIAFLCFLLMFATAACGGKNTTSESGEGTPVITEKLTSQPVYSKYYDYLGGKNVMPIGTYGGPQISQLTDEFFTLFKECGIGFFSSTVDGSNDKANAEKFLDLCDEYEIGTFLTMSSIRGHNVAAVMTTEKLETALSEFAGHESFMGFELQDEPTVAQTVTLNKTVKAFEASRYAYLDMYYNALPDYAEPTSLSGSIDYGITFEEYCRGYIENLEATYFSYDYYPFGKYGTISQNYITCMATVRNVCEDMGVPFWTYIQCGADFGYGLKECIPDEDRFRWNVATCLAYGAKGIQYFTLSQWSGFYDAIKDNDPEAETRVGMIGAKNNINQWYYYAKDANAHIAAVDSILMNATNMGVIFNGTSPVKQSTGREVITSEKFRQLIAVEGSSALVGCFDYKGGTALYVVNNSVTKKGTIRLDFDNNYYYLVTQKTVTTEKTGRSLELSLDKGEGVLVVLR